MFKLVVVVLALAAVGIQGRPHNDAVVYDCTDKSNGIYGDAADPTAYFTCKDGIVAETTVCQEGYIFNGVDACVPEVIEEEKNEAEEKDRQTIPQVFTDDDDVFIDDDLEGGRGRKLIYNVEFTKNVFPRSVVIIGKMNREQKNK